MKTEPNRAVANLRKIIGKTQEQFAVMLGVSKETIVSVENGRNRLTPGLAYRIYVATGADKTSLLENAGTVQFIGKNDSRRVKAEYTKESFDQWRKEVYDADLNDPKQRKQAAQMFFDHIKGRLEVLLIAATRPGIKGRDRFPAVAQSLEEWVDYAYEEFELAQEVDEVLREETSWPVINRLSVGFLRDAMKNGNTMKFKFKDSKKFKDTDLIDVEYDYYDMWDGPYIPSPERKKPTPKPKPEGKAAPEEKRTWDFGTLFSDAIIPPKV